MHERRKVFSLAISVDLTLQLLPLWGPISRVFSGGGNAKGREASIVHSVRGILLFVVEKIYLQTRLSWFIYAEWGTFCVGHRIGDAF